MNEIRILPPEELYGQLFYDVMSMNELFGKDEDSHKDKLFADSKDFVDCVPKQDVQTILAEYEKLGNKYNVQQMRGFLKNYFEIPEYHSSSTDTSEIKEHIYKLWNILKKERDDPKSGTLIPLKHPYIIPGGRFREIYYWDSYFTMLGLQVDKQDQIIQDMIDNFTDLIDAYGFIPNGNRTYYLSRSQPPFYSLMIEILCEIRGDAIYSKYLEYLIKEYHFWMNGIEKLDDTNTAIQHVVRLDGGEVLNRYWDSKNTPRSEMYRDDIITAKQAVENIPSRSKEDVYRDLRSAAESGWDFSTRWFENPSNLYSIQTTKIIPVDLNALLYHLELTISKAYEYNHDFDNAKEFQEKAGKRKKALIKYCWNQQKGFFMDYHFVQKRQTEVYSLAGVYPLFFKIASDEQARLVAKKINDSFLQLGGLVSTLSINEKENQQQWDWPNAWAPLQWIAIAGLRNYDEDELADGIKERWTELNRKIYTIPEKKNSFKLLEKYNVVNEDETGGGEYKNQDGFGWTNGVYQRLIKEKKIR